MRISTVLAAAALASLAGAASAIPLSVTDTIDFTTITKYDADLDGYGGKSINKLEGSGDFVAWTHHFGFAQPVATINNASLAVTLKDDQHNDGIELAFGFAENGQWAFGLVSNATYTYNLAVQTLYDGSFSINLVSLLGDFLITKSVLNVNYTPVPEPATLSLLGLGVLGAAFGCRRRAKKALAA